MVSGTRDHAEQLRDEVTAVLAPIGLRLSETKTRICHIDEGFDFLGLRVQRKHRRGTNTRHVYTYPSTKALASIIDKVRVLTRRSWHRDLVTLLNRLNPVLRGWCNYFRHGASKRAFGYVDSFAWRRIITWLRKRHFKLNWATIRRRHLPTWEITADGVTMFRPRAVPVTRYRTRFNIPAPWTTPGPAVTTA